MTWVPTEVPKATGRAPVPGGGFVFSPSILLGIGLSLLIAPGRARASDAPAVDDAATIEQILDDLQVMEALLEGRVNNAARGQLQERTALIRVRLEAVQEDLLRHQSAAAMNAAAVNHPEGRSPLVGDPASLVQGLIPMEAETFALLLIALQNETSTPIRLQALGSACQRNLFSAAQGILLLREFQAQEEQIEAAVMLWPRLVDPHSAHLLEAELGDPESRAELRRRLGL